MEKLYKTTVFCRSIRSQILQKCYSELVPLLFQASLKSSAFTTSDRLQCKLRQEYMTKMLRCHKRQTADFLQNNPHILRMGQDKFTKIIDLFAANSITCQDVLTYPEIFKRKYETIKVRMDDLQELTGLTSIRLSMVNLSQKEFDQRYQNYVEESNVRDEFQDKCGLLMKSLNITKKSATALIKSSLFLSNSKLSTIRKKLDLYLSIEPELAEDIRDRIWLLMYPMDAIESKLNELKRLKIPIFIWRKSLNRIMKLSGKKYNALLQEMVRNSSIYDDCRSKEEYICKQLNCSESALQTMVSKYPHLLSVKIGKLQNHLNLLRHQFGFSNEDIIRNSLVFKFSEETLRLRFYELQKYEPSLPNLWIMTKDRKGYVSSIEKLKVSSL